MFRRRLHRWYERAVLVNAPGLGPSLIRVIYRLVSIGFALAVLLRRAAYAASLVRPYRAPVPVISVGNLTAGGSGKTPAAIWVCRRLARRGLRVALLSRGYGRTQAGTDDEAPPPGVLPDGVVRLTGPRRDRLAEEAVRLHGAQAIVLDDGFQHWRLARDVDLICIDALDPFGNGRLLPAGPLREPLGALRRATAFLLTRTDLCDAESLGTLRARIRALAGDRPVTESVHRPAALVGIGAAALPDHAPEWLRSRAVYAFCGIGNPRSFEGTLAALRADVAKCRRFPDHHLYTEDDLCRIVAEAREFMAEVLVTTEKDAARLGDADLSMPLYTLRVELDVTRGEDDLEAVFAEILGKTSAPPREAVQPELPA